MIKADGAEVIIKGTPKNIMVETMLILKSVKSGLVEVLGETNGEKAYKDMLELSNMTEDEIEEKVKRSKEKAFQHDSGKFFEVFNGIMEDTMQQRLEVREIKEEPDVQNIRSSSNKNKPITDYHRLSEKYRVANRYKNIMIGIVTALVMWYNDWICVESIPLRLLYAGGIVLVMSFLCGAVDEILMEE